MRQHHKTTQTSGKTKRRRIYARGLEILKTMATPIDKNGKAIEVTKSVRRKMFAKARKVARAELKQH